MTVVRPVSARSVAFAAGVISLLVLLRSLSCDFVNFDDQESVLENAAIRSIDLNMLVSSFSTSMFGFWMPLTWISYSVDYHFWGLNPVGYHLTNIVLHAVNTGLVVLVADRLLGGDTRGAGEKRLYPAMLLIAGLLWGIHPLRVESVTWVTERKDVLNGLFAISSLLAYLRYVKTRESGAAAWRSYLLSLVLFACSLMAKPVTVVLPLMFLVLDRYPLDRLRHDTLVPLLVEKLPFLLFSAALSALTLTTATEKKLLIAVDLLSIGERFLVSGNALFEYLRLFVLPTGILPLHPIPYPLPASYFAASTVTLLLICCCMYSARRFMAVPVAGLLYLLPLLPVLGFFQNGQQAFAARYTYLPHIAVSIAAAALALKICRSHEVPWSRYTLVAFAVFLLAMAGMTQFQIGIWNNSAALWSRVIERHRISMAYKSRGSYYLMNGLYNESVADFTVAMETASGVEKLEIYNLLAGRGMALGSLGRFDESIRDFSAAIKLFPHPAYYYSRGITFEAMGLTREAQEDLKLAGPDPGDIKWFEYGKGLGQ